MLQEVLGDKILEWWHLVNCVETKTHVKDHTSRTEEKAAVVEEVDSRAVLQAAQSDKMLLTMPGKLPRGSDRSGLGTCSEVVARQPKFYAEVLARLLQGSEVEV